MQTDKEQQEKQTTTKLWIWTKLAPRTLWRAFWAQWVTKKTNWKKQTINALAANKQTTKPNKARASTRFASLPQGKTTHANCARWRALWLQTTIINALAANNTNEEPKENALTEQSTWPNARTASGDAYDSCIELMHFAKIITMCTRRRAGHKPTNAELCASMRLLASISSETNNLNQTKHARRRAESRVDASSGHNKFQNKQRNETKHSRVDTQNRSSTLLLASVFCCFQHW